MKVNFDSKIGFSQSYIADRNKNILDNGIEKPQSAAVSVPNLPYNSKQSDNIFKTGISNIWKGFTVFNTMMDATAKGIFYGVLGSLVSGTVAFWSKFPSQFKAIKLEKSAKIERISNLATELGKNVKLPNKIKVANDAFRQVMKHPFKTMGIKGLVISGLIGAAIFAGNVILGKLNSNQKTAVIDHKLNIGHRDK